MSTPSAPSVQSSAALLYAARRLAADHRPVLLSEGFIGEHAAECHGFDDDWYRETGARDPEMDADAEVWAAHYGPPCRLPDRWPVVDGVPAPMCVHCTGVFEGRPVPHPCGEALIAAYALRQPS